MNTESPTSYQPYTVKFGNENKEDIDDKDKKGALERAERFILSIMNGEVEDIEGSDGKISVVRNVVKLETGKTRDIIIREITIPFWQACIDGVNPPKPDTDVRIAAVGTPGIGKTTSTPLLIRMLLEQGKTVVYLIRSENIHQDVVLRIYPRLRRSKKVRKQGRVQKQ